jgi:hypothetical protein
MDLANYKATSVEFTTSRHAQFSVYSILIAVQLANLFVYYDRKIQLSEQYWFEGSRAHHDVFVGTKWQHIYNDYVLLVERISHLSGLTQS